MPEEARTAQFDVQRHDAAGIVSTAEFSACGGYRYSLTRQWSDTRARLLFVLLNPSTADAAHNDPTVARCMRRAQLGGFGAFRVVNLFAYRATRPADLFAAASPIGPDNDKALVAGARWADHIICGWGAHGAHLGRNAAVGTLLRQMGKPLLALGTTRCGNPRHPLYLPYGLAAQPWEAP